VERIPREDVVHRYGFDEHTRQRQGVAVVHDDAVGDSQQPIARPLVPSVFRCRRKHDRGSGLTKPLDQIRVEVVSRRIRDQYEVGRLRVGVVASALRIDVDHGAAELDRHAGADERRDFDVTANGRRRHLVVALRTAGADCGDQCEKCGTRGETTYDLFHR
jgi:hypothetical protein